VDLRPLTLTVLALHALITASRTFDLTYKIRLLAKLVLRDRDLVAIQSLFHFRYIQKQVLLAKLCMYLPINDYDNVSFRRERFCRLIRFTIHVPLAITHPNKQSHIYTYT